METNVEEQTVNNSNDYTQTSNKYVFINDKKLAYRTLGLKKNKLPIVLFQHFTGTMDDWDSEFIEGLADERQVIVFDNLGIGVSKCKTPDSVEEMTEIAEAFMETLGLTRIDALGFSLGGCIVQQIMKNKPGLIRRAIVSGTTPKGAEGFDTLSQIVSTGMKHSEERKLSLKHVLFFRDNPRGRKSGIEFEKRVNNHSVDQEPQASNETTQAQLIALESWGKGKSNKETLQLIEIPVLIINGSQDVMAPVESAVKLYKFLPNAELILMPDSGHGALFQFNNLLLNQLNAFLEREF